MRQWLAAKWVLGRKDGRMRSELVWSEMWERRFKEGRRGSIRLQFPPGPLHWQQGNCSLIQRISDIAKRSVTHTPNSPLIYWAKKKRSLAERCGSCQTIELIKDEFLCNVWLQHENKWITIRKNLYCVYAANNTINKSVEVISERSVKLNLSCFPASLYSSNFKLCLHLWMLWCRMNPLHWGYVSSDSILSRNMYMFYNVPSRQIQPKHLKNVYYWMISDAFPEPQLVHYLKY